jgi:hypothetical protein
MDGKRATIPSAVPAATVVANQRNGDISLMWIASCLPTIQTESFKTSYVAIQYPRRICFSVNVANQSSPQHSWGAISIAWCCILAFSRAAMLGFRSLVSARIV